MQKEDIQGLMSSLQQMNELLAKVLTPENNPENQVAEAPAEAPVPEKTAQETPIHNPTDEEVDELIRQGYNSQTFTAEAKSRWGISREPARELYRQGKKREPITTQPVPEEGATKEPEEISAPEPAVTEPVMGTAREQALLLLRTIEEEARKQYENDYIIEAIKIIKDKAGFDILTAKAWVDTFDSDFTGDVQPELVSAKEEFIAKFISGKGQMKA